MKNVFINPTLCILLSHNGSRTYKSAVKCRKVLNEPKKSHLTAREDHRLNPEDIDIL